MRPPFLDRMNKRVNLTEALAPYTQANCGEYRHGMCLWGGDGRDAVCGYDVPDRNRTREMKAQPCQKLRVEAKLQCPACAGTGREHDNDSWQETPCVCQEGTDE